LKRRLLRWLLAAAFLAAGVLHLTHPAPFARIVPPWVPQAQLVVLATGWCEVAGAIGLLLPATRRWAGALLALYALCVWPANVQHMLLFAQAPHRWTGWLYHGPRQLLQPVIIWWCLYAGEVIDWPFTARSRAAPPAAPPRTGAKG
jgi:uncharacterized membrane protein